MGSGTLMVLGPGPAVGSLAATPRRGMAVARASSVGLALPSPSRQVHRKLASMKNPQRRPTSLAPSGCAAEPDSVQRNCFGGYDDWA